MKKEPSKKVESGPDPRVIGEPKKPLVIPAPVDSKTDKKEAVKGDEPKKDSPKANDSKKAEPKPKPVEVPMVPKVEEKKEEPKLKTVELPMVPKVEEKKEEPKKEDPKAEEKKEDPNKEDLPGDIKKAADAAGVATQRGDNAWLLVASAFVFLMTPGLALFYGGMVRKKNLLATMMHSYASLAVVGLYWIAFGYGLAFGPSQFKLSILGVEDGGIIGWDWKLFFLQGVKPGDLLPTYNIPVLTHVMFQGMFAIITPALISGAVAERIRFWPWTIFMVLWVTVVYCPLAHMVWAFDWFAVDPATPGKGIGESAIGLLGKMGALDFAGGTVVHIAAGFAGLACIFVLKKRKGYGDHSMHPNSMVLTLIGAGLLWFGWFGFNGGSGLNSSDLAATGFATTQAAAAAAGLSWCLVEWLFKGKPTALGLASGIVAGLVAVTPASGFVYVWGGAAIGAIAGIVCYFAVQLKTMLGYDDSLDAFGVHGVGGFLGAVLTGVFCYAAVQSLSVDGYFAHTGYQSNIEKLKKEIESLKKEIPELEKTKGSLEKAVVDAEAAAAKAKAGKDKEDAEKKVAEAKAALDDLPNKVKRRNDRIAAIGREKDKTKADDNGEGEIGDYEGKIEKAKKEEKGPMTQLVIQIKASIFSAVLAFVVTLILAIVVQVITLGNFRTSEADETEGLDYTEHGETGFDFGGLDTIPTASAGEPKAAKVPPGGKRFEVIVEGVENGGLIQAWSALCQPTGDPIDPDFKAIYPYVTTVQGNRFRLRGGDPKSISASIQRLFSKKLAKQLKVRVEE